MHVKEVRRRNLRALARAVGGVTQLANRLGKSQSQISHLIGTNPVKSIGDKFAAQVERAFEKPHGWLDQLHSDIEEIPVQQSGTLRKSSYQVPILTWQEVHAWIDPQRQEALRKKIHNFVTIGTKVSPQAFAVVVEGDSMEAPSGISFPTGAVIIIDPEHAAGSGAFVLAKPTPSSQPIFKQFMIDGNKRFLKPLNPRYPIIDFFAQGIICGVVRLMLVEFK